MKTSPTPHDDNKLEQWLDNLQRESWQMELVISAIAIFLLVGGREALSNYEVILQNQPFQSFLATALATSLIQFGHFILGVLIVSLILHLTLRGLWIGMIGLQSVTPSIDYQKLNFGSFFTNKLSSKYHSVKDLVISLDKWCSLIFSASFLLVFSMMSFFTFILFATLFYPLAQFTLDKPILKTLANVLLLAYFIGGLLYAFDFLSFGLLKKNNAIAKLYHPIYRFYSIITLAPLYRGLYYTLISSVNRWFFVGIVIAVFSVWQLKGDIRYDTYNYFLYDGNEQSMHANYYANEKGADERIEKISIPSQIISTSYLPLFIRHWVIDNEVAYELCQDARDTTEVLSYNTQSGSFRFSTNDNQISNFEPYISPDKLRQHEPAKIEAALQCLEQMYSIHLNDSLVQHPEFFFYEHPNKKEKGIKTVLSIEHLPKGKNTLQVMKKDFNNKILSLIGQKDSIVTKPYATVHFWKE